MGTASANCTVGVQGDNKATAIHDPGSGPAANCTFTFEAYCARSRYDINSDCYYLYLYATQYCFVNAADGLPVELMDYAIQ